MFARLAFSVFVIGALGAGDALAQATPPASTTTQVTRDPVLGDPGTKPPAKRRMRVKRAKDAPSPGSSDGNQPDRAEAGGGGR